MYESLTKFIPLVERTESYGEWIADREHAGTPDNPKRWPYVGYSGLVIEVEEAVYVFVDAHPEMGLMHYSSILEQGGLEWGFESMEGADVSTLDGRVVMALLVGAIRAERFCDGALKRFFERGCIARWLRRLREIDAAGTS